MKKIAAWGISICLLMGLCTGCGNADRAKQPDSQTVNDDAGQSTENNESEEGEDIEEGNSEEENSEEETVYEIPDVIIEPYEVPDTEAFAFVRDMKIGWNLGNTFDAYGQTFANELDSETSWVGIATSKSMIDDIHEAGFQTMRLPVSWHEHLVDENYTISEVWLDRVQEVADYAIDNGMYVILNIHHDNSEEFLYPDSVHLEQSINYVTAIWTQLSERFKDYDEHLIFEAMNEPRLVGSTYEWWLDNSKEECQDAVACINELNQAFVNVVRASGGNNTERYLMIPGYDASPDGALNSGFVFPTDAEGVTDKLLISVHAYTPYNFALQGQGESGSTDSFDSERESSIRDIDYFMDRLYNTYISQGIPVVIGEFGARDKDGNLQDRVDYATYYIAAARAHGMTCVWWDNNAFTGSGENFGLYYRRGGYFLYPEIIEALMKYAQ